MESICQGLRAKINISSRESRFDEFSEAFETASLPFLETFKSWFCIWFLPPLSPWPNARRSCTLSLPLISVWISLPPGFLNLGCPHVSICLVLFLSDSVILLIDYQWAQVAAELNTVFGLFLVGNRGLAVSYRILPRPSNKDSGLRWDATTPTQHCSGCQRGNILLTPMETHFRSKDFLTMLVVIWQIW